MFNNTKLLKKLVVSTLFFFILISVAVDFNFAQNEDTLEKARTLFLNGNEKGSIKQLNEFIDRIKDIQGQEKKAAEAFYLLAKICYTYQRNGWETVVDKNLKMAFKMYPDFSKEEPDHEFRAKVEQIKKEVAAESETNQEDVTPPEEETDVREKGIKVVFIVDVSPSLKNRKYLITRFVGGLIDSFENENIKQKEYHLVTFCEKPKFFKPNQQRVKDEIVEEIKSEIVEKSMNNSLETYPIYAFINIFKLIEKNFPQKVGIVIFISDGEDSRNSEISRIESRKARDDLKQVIIAIKKTGFTVYNVFVDTGINDLMCEPCMKMIAHWSGTKLLKIETRWDIIGKIDSLRNKIENTNFISPVPRMEFKTKEKEWNERGLKSLQPVNKKNKFFAFTIPFFIGIFSVILIGLVWRKMWPPPPPPNGVDMLWGKLDPQKEGLEIIDLSKKTPGLWLTPPKKLPALEFNPAKRKGKKVITVSYEEGRVTFCNKSKKLARNDYIDAETCFVKIFHPDQKISHEYKYIFLNKLKEICENPVWRKDEFKGRDTIVNEIRDNFLREEGDCRHYLISGMGNSGKTSLMQHLYHIGLGKDDRILQQYSISLVEFDPKDYTTFTGLEKEITKQLESYKGGQRKLILIDEYDKLYEKFKDEFCEYIKKYSFNQEYFFILSGRKGRDLLEMRFFEHMSSFIECEKLEGLDYVKSIPGETCKKSLELIESLISDIGFPSRALEIEARREIVKYASGFPWLIKKILLELMMDWLAHFDKKTIKAKHVEDTVGKIKEHAKDFLLLRAVVFDEESITGPIPATEVRIRDILNKLSVDYKGKGPKSKIKAELIIHPDPVIVVERGKSFEKKVTQLKDMGFIKEVEEDNGNKEDNVNLIGIPYMCFYKGETIASSKENDKGGKKIATR